MSQYATSARIGLTELAAMKAAGEPAVALTAYDAAFAALIDSAGVDVVLVGDSVGMVVQGQRTTIPVTVDEMVYHASLVARGLSRAMLMVDMPFMSYATAEDALHNATRLMKEGGAEIVKLEWGALQLPMVRRLSECGVPVCAHLGLTPQSVFKTGGYRVQGRDDETAAKMRRDAAALTEAGADMLLLECVPMTLARQITEASPVPVIGIGAGPDVDGQILVLYDILDIAPGKRTRFSKNYLVNGRTIPDAVAAYAEDVRSRRFPSDEFAFA